MKKSIKKAQGLLDEDRKVREGEKKWCRWKISLGASQESGWKGKKVLPISKAEKRTGRAGEWGRERKGEEGERRAEVEDGRE